MMPTDPLSPVEAEIASRLRQVADEAADLYWPFNARDVIDAVPTRSGSRRPRGGSLRRWRPWTHRLMVIAMAVAILVVFFVPLPHLSFFKRLVSPAKISPTRRPSIGTRTAHGTIFVANAGKLTGGTGKGSITAYRPGATGNTRPELVITAGVDGPNDIAFDSLGDLWVANYSNNP